MNWSWSTRLALCKAGRSPTGAGFEAGRSWREFKPFVEVSGPLNEREAARAEAI